MKVAIIGLGWYGLPLGRSLSAKAIVVGTKSTQAGVAEAEVVGIAATVLSMVPEVKIENTELLADTDCAVVNLPPGRSSAGMVNQYFSRIQSLTGILAKGNLQHLLFVSSTGVFGEHQQEVDEHTIAEPTTESGRALAECEAWLWAKWKGRLSILRPAGLVGDSRHPGRFLAGRQNLPGKNHPVNLVHRDDLIALTHAIIETDFGSKIWHAVAAAHPAKEAYYTRAAQALNLPMPGFDQSDYSLGRTVHGDISRKLTLIKFKYDDPHEML